MSCCTSPPVFDPCGTIHSTVNHSWKWGAKCRQMAASCLLLTTVRAMVVWTHRDWRQSRMRLPPHNALAAGETCERSVPSPGQQCDEANRSSPGVGLFDAWYNWLRLLPKETASRHASTGIYSMRPCMSSHLRPLRTGRSGHLRLWQHSGNHDRAAVVPRRADDGAGDRLRQLSVMAGYRSIIKQLVRSCGQKLTRSSI